jgi:hypothetical protein
MSQQEPFFQQVRNTSNVTLDIILSGMVVATTTAQTTAGAAYDQANTATGNALSANATALVANTNATTGINIAKAAYSEANAAYTQANTATTAAAAAQATATSANAATGVTPNTYGDDLHIPVFSVDARGRITGVTSTALADFSTGSDGIVKASGTVNPAYFLTAINSFVIPPLFTSTTPGYVKASGGANTALFLDQAGNFSVPLFGGGQSAASNGYTTLPGGIILQWGQVAAIAGVTNHSFNIAFPHNVFNIQVTSASNNNTLGSEFHGVLSAAQGGQGAAPTTSQFSYYQNNSGTINWFAIGN